MAEAPNWETIAGKWNQIGDEVKKQWGMFTDDELVEIDGNREVLAGKIQEKYGIAKPLADRQIDKWTNKLKV